MKKPVRADSLVELQIKHIKRDIIRSFTEESAAQLLVMIPSLEEVRKLMDTEDKDLPDRWKKVNCLIEEFKKTGEKQVWTK